MTAPATARRIGEPGHGGGRERRLCSNQAPSCRPSDCSQPWPSNLAPHVPTC